MGRRRELLVLMLFARQGGLRVSSLGFLELAGLGAIKQLQVPLAGVKMRDVTINISLGGGWPLVMRRDWA